MNGNVKKLLYSTAALLALGASPSQTFAQNCRDNCPPCPFEQGFCAPDQFSCAYNAPARPEVRSCLDVFLSASALYWHVDQNAMDFAVRMTGPEKSLVFLNQKTVVAPKFKYHPGFKVGLGFRSDHDNWVVSADYTRLHQASRKSSVAKVGEGEDATFLLTSFFPMNAINLARASSINSKWRVNFDSLDLQVSRPFYQGYCLTVNPFAGIQGLLLRQTLNLRVEEVDAPLFSRNHSKGWSIGPMAGVETSFLLGCGFRLTSEIGGSLLYTRYKVANKSGGTAVTVSSRANTMTPIAKLAMGLSWRNYFNRQNYHFDITAKYEFLNVFQANYMRSFVDSLSTLTRIGTGSEPASLHLHGPTLTARLDF